MEVKDEPDNLRFWCRWLKPWKGKMARSLWKGWPRTPGIRFLQRTQRSGLAAAGEYRIGRARTGTVALGGEANHFQIAFDDDLGYLTDGRVLDSGEFYIKANLDKDNPRAVGLHKQLGSGKKLGLSVLGRVTESHTEGEDAGN